MVDKRDLYSPEEKRWRRRQTAATMNRLREQQAELATAANSYAGKARLWRRFNLVLGLPSALLAALAGVAAFSELVGSVAVGITAFVSAALTATIAFFRPEENRRAGETKAAGYRTLADDVRDFVEIDSLNPEVLADAQYFLQDLGDRRAAVEKGDPAPDRWVRGRPVGAGDVDYSWLLDTDSTE